MTVDALLQTINQIKINIGNKIDVEEFMKSIFQDRHEEKDREDRIISRSNDYDRPLSKAYLLCFIRFWHFYLKLDPVTPSGRKCLQTTLKCYQRKKKTHFVFDAFCSKIVLGVRFF